MRKDYNKHQTELYLYVLHCYAFHHMIRFNNKHEYNVSVGIRRYSKDARERILKFNCRADKLLMYNKDYKELDYNKLEIGNTVYYFDPPYTVTDAVYQDGKRGFKGWSKRDDKELFELLDRLNSQGKKWLLSDVIKHRGKENRELIEWLNNREYKMIDIGRIGKRYQRNEVIIRNY